MESHAVIKTISTFPLLEDINLWKIELDEQNARDLFEMEKMKKMVIGPIPKDG